MLFRSVSIVVVVVMMVVTLVIVLMAVLFRVMPVCRRYRHTTSRLFGEIGRRSMIVFSIHRQFLRLTSNTNEQLRSIHRRPWRALRCS